MGGWLCRPLAPSAGRRAMTWPAFLALTYCEEGAVCTDHLVLHCNTSTQTER